MKFKQWLYNEVDWDKTWSDVEKSCLDTNKLVEYLNDVISNRGVKTDKRKKFPNTMPYIHSSSELLGTGDLDLDDFIEKITEKPNNVVNTNEKMLKSGFPNEFVYKTGIPAFRGIIYDIEKNKFFIINTCPGAGECVVICYARKNNFIRYPEAYDSMIRRLNYMLNYPDEYENMLYEELKEKCEKHEAKIGYEPKVLFRWNDSGDFFSKRYRIMAHRVMRKLTSKGYNIADGAYTKVADAVNDPNLSNIAYSTGGKKSEKEKIAKLGKISEWIPKKLFADLDIHKITDKIKLKQRVADVYGYNFQDILTYGEMMRTANLGIPKYHVIVTPKDGDDALHRKDVVTILLTEH
jgi:hypothetical protein